MMRPARVPASERTLIALLELGARVNADRVLVRTETGSLTYAEALERAAARAGALAAAGDPRHPASRPSCSASVFVRAAGGKPSSHA